MGLSAFLSVFSRLAWYPLKPHSGWSSLQVRWSYCVVYSFRLTVFLSFSLPWFCTYVCWPGGDLLLISYSLSQSIYFLLPPLSVILMGHCLPFGSSFSTISSIWGAQSQSLVYSIALLQSYQLSLLLSGSGQVSHLEQHHMWWGSTPVPSSLTIRICSTISITLQWGHLPLITY